MSVTTAPPKTPSVPPAPPAGIPPGGSAIGDPPDPPNLSDPRRRRTTLRIVLGCLIVLLCSAGASAVFVLEQVHTLRDALSQNKALNLPSGTLASAGWGDPQTLLLVGDDQRKLTKYYLHAVLPHSNEMLLVRIDPSKPYISMMSIPRELEATIYPPNAQPITTRFNYAYTAGGIPLLVSTIKRVLGLSVNHVMVITFARFQRAVNEMGCVYSTIDRRYYHVNTPTSEQYQEINLQPGYQKLCGTQALEFVSYRHGDTSLVRDARDQSFLLDVKKQYGPTLTSNVGKFERIFGRAVQTDRGLQSTTGLLNLIGTLITSAGRRVRVVQFQANLVPPGATPCACVTATPQQISASVHAFLHGGSPIPRRSTAAIARAVHSKKAAAKLPLVPTSVTELESARALAAKLPFRTEYPRVQDRGGSIEPAYLRNYLLHATGPGTYPAYVAVFSAGQLGQYYDVQGMTWTSAPQFASPGQTVHVASRTYSLYYEGANLKMIAWREHGAVYWIRNSLTDSVSNGELLAIAEQTSPVTASRTKRSAGGRKRLKVAAVPNQAPAASTTDLKQLLGSLAGLLTLLVVPLLAIPLLKRRRQLADLRAHLQTSLQTQARLQHAVGGAATLPAVPLAPPGPLPPAASLASPPAYLPRTVRAKSRPRTRSRVLAGAGVVVLAAAIVLGVLLTRGNGKVPTAPAAHHGGVARVANAPAIPVVPVAVLNATSTPGAAKALATQLASKAVRIAAVGNLNQSRPAGLWILYAPGDQSQAASVARLLAGRATTIAPMDSAARAAAGSAAGVVVEIT